jgi:hypothetical protein
MILGSTLAVRGSQIGRRFICEQRAFLKLFPAVRLSSASAIGDSSNVYWTERVSMNRRRKHRS